MARAILEKRAGMVSLDYIKPLVKNLNDINPVKNMKYEKAYSIIRTVLKNLKTGKRIVETAPAAGTLKYLTRGVLP